MNFKSIKLYKDKELVFNRMLEELIDFGYTTVKSVSQAGEFARRGGILDIFPLTFECPVRIEMYNNLVQSIYSYDINTGNKIDEHDIMIILPIWGQRGYKHLEDETTLKKISDAGLKQGYDVSLTKFNEKIPIDYFVDIKRGDYVVHIYHGIGIFRGFKKLREPDGIYKKYLTIEYADSEKLYIPIEDMHLVQKFIGIEGRPPKVYKLGTNQWRKVKQQTKEKIWNLAYDLLELQAKRSILRGYSFSKDTDWQKELEEEFPYKETLDQLKATLEVKKDMEFPQPMDRLLCGDVGYGKTEVALRAAFKAMMDNKQVAILVPTTILAEQHYQTFSKRLFKFPVNIEMLSRFVNSFRQRKIIKELKSGEVDVVIGTHKLLSKDVKFKDLGLVIIDEEQRFGVNHKEKLKHLRLMVDILTLTATPIPRTLYMSLMGAKDMSVIETPPSARIPIFTKVTRYDKEIVRRAVKREIDRGGQIFFVHNRVYDIGNVANKLRNILPDIRIAISHGQMPNKELEEVIIEFINRKIDLLVTTTIIQSGIDIPNVNTLIVNNADTFGLADLYQLKGRVGRFNRKAYAYFLIPKKAVLTEPAKKRLDAIQKHTELGAGFKIAMKDLMIRGAGNLLGAEQHGYIMAVGFDLYCRLLREAISHLSIKKDSLKPELISNLRSN